MLPEFESLSLTPIGVVRSPFVQRQDAPRQSAVAPDVRGQIELFSGRGYENALMDIEEWSHLWVLFWFHLNQGWRPMVRPPRGDRRRGVFATRSPHRPNPLGLSVVKLEGRSGLVLEVSGLDILDGSPVFDLKPYVAYTDALGGAEQGWLAGAADPIPAYSVEFEARATAELELLRGLGHDLGAAIERALRLGPAQPRYRRIKREGAEFTIAIRRFRARFIVSEQRVRVLAVESGLSARDLHEGTDPDLDVHRALSAFRG